MKRVARDLFGCALMVLLWPSIAFAQWSIIFHTWYGTSRCVDRQRYPSCADEQVVYEIRPLHGRSDTISVVAERIVNDKRTFLGDYRLAHTQDSTWSGEIPTAQSHRLTLRYTARRFTGELVDRASNRLVRVIALIDDGSIWRRRISAPESLVAKLYRELAGEAVMNDSELAPHDLFFESRDVMRHYLDPSLIGLILEDRRCSERMQGICALDFSPIWNSQDPAGTQIDFLKERDTTRIAVQLRHSYDGRLDTLTYRMIKTPAGWRIHDIEYSNHKSLVTMLRGKPPS
jgi:hypothetical protein